MAFLSMSTPCCRETLPIEEVDLCGFLFNLLDNAVEAAAKTEHSEIVCSLQIRQQHLAIRCEKHLTMGCCKQMKTDSYAPQSRMPADHGFGLCRCEPSPRSTAAYWLSAMMTPASP